MEQTEIRANSHNKKPQLDVSNVLHSSIDSLKNVLESISDLHDNSGLQNLLYELMIQLLI